MIHGEAPISNGKVVEVQTPQTSDFTATVGADGVLHEWPIDVSASAATSELVVSTPAAPTAGDRFAVSDAVLACTLTRSIKVDFPTQNLDGMTAPQFAVIQDAGVRFEFIYIDAAIGWKICANLNS